MFSELQKMLINVPLLRYQQINQKLISFFDSRYKSVVDKKHQPTFWTTLSEKKIFAKFFAFCFPNNQPSDVFLHNLGVASMLLLLLLLFHFFNLQNWNFVVVFKIEQTDESQRTNEIKFKTFEMKVWKFWKMN